MPVHRRSMGGDVIQGDVIQRSRVMGRNLLRAAVLSSVFVIGSLGQVALAEQSAKPSNKWRIEVDNTAKNTGAVVFRVTPVQGTATEVSVSVADEEGENKIAQSIRDAMQAQLPPDRYDVEVDDGEDVLIKRKSGQPDFVVELASTNVEGTEFEVERE
jgi:hypothetical protein